MSIMNQKKLLTKLKIQRLKHKRKFYIVKRIKGKDKSIKKSCLKIVLCSKERDTFKCYSSEKVIPCSNLKPSKTYEGSIQNDNSQGTADSKISSHACKEVEQENQKEKIFDTCETTVIAIKASGTTNFNSKFEAWNMTRWKHRYLLKDVKILLEDLRLIRKDRLHKLLIGLKVDLQILKISEEILSTNISSKTCNKKLKYLNYKKNPRVELYNMFQLPNLKFLKLIDGLKVCKIFVKLMMSNYDIHSLSKVFNRMLSKAHEGQFSQSSHSEVKSIKKNVKRLQLNQIDSLTCSTKGFNKEKGSALSMISNEKLNSKSMPSFKINKEIVSEHKFNKNISAAKIGILSFKRTSYCENNNDFNHKFTNSVIDSRESETEMIEAIKFKSNKEMYLINSKRTDNDTSSSTVDQLNFKINSSKSLLNREQSKSIMDNLQSSLNKEQSNSESDNNTLLLSNMQQSNCRMDNIGLASNIDQTKVLYKSHIRLPNTNMNNISETLSQPPLRLNINSVNEGPLLTIKENMCNLSSNSIVGMLNRLIYNKYKSLNLHNKLESRSNTQIQKKDHNLISRYFENFFLFLNNSFWTVDFYTLQHIQTSLENKNASKNVKFTVCVNENQLFKLLNNSAFGMLIKSEYFRFGMFLSAPSDGKIKRVAQIILQKRCLLLLHHSVIHDYFFGRFLSIVLKRNGLLSKCMKTVVYVPRKTFQEWTYVNQNEIPSKLFKQNFDFLSRELKTGITVRLINSDQIASYSSIDTLKIVLKNLHKKLSFSYQNVSLLIGNRLKPFASANEFYKVQTLDAFIRT